MKAIPLAFRDFSGLPIRHQTERAKESPLLSSATSTILLIEPHEFIRSCILSWLQHSCPECDVVCATGFEAGIVTMMPMQPVIAILSDDPSHPSIEWIEHQSSFVFDCFPGTPIVAIVRSEKLHAVAVASNRLGLQGYIPTSTPPAVAAAAMHLIIAGGTYFPLVISDGESVTRGGASATKCDRLPANTLSDRERAVAELVGRGMQNKLIAYELNISLSTVKAHVHRISRKLNVRNRTELAVHITTPNEAHVFEGGLQSISIVP